MSRIRRIIASVICLMLVSLTHVQAQSPGNTALELTQIHTTDAGWSFRYPDGWTVNESPSGIVVKNHEFNVNSNLTAMKSGDLVITISAGAALSKLIGFPLRDESPGVALDEVVNGLATQDPSSLLAGNTREFNIGDLPAAEFQASISRLDILVVLVH